MNSSTMKPLNSLPGIGSGAKRRPSQPVSQHDNVLESFRDIGSSVSQNTRNAVTKVATDAFSSLLGGDPYIDNGNPGTEGRPAPWETPSPQIRTPDILSPHRMNEEQVKVKQAIEAVRSELEGLAKAIGSLSSDIHKTIQEIPVEPGVYHLNFFERLKSVLHMLRVRVSDSNSWLDMFKQNSKKKSGYWTKYKKHGTKFGLSADRTPATQTG